MTPVTWTFTTAAARSRPVLPCTIWPATADPGGHADPDAGAVELGVKFRADASGHGDRDPVLQGQRQHRHPHRHLWSGTGTCWQPHLQR